MAGLAAGHGMPARLVATILACLGDWRYAPVWALILSVCLFRTGSRGHETDEPGTAEPLATVEAPAPALVLLPPGQVVNAAPPPDWTHLVIKSIPRPASGDWETLPESARQLASAFRTVIVAAVRPGGDEAHAGPSLERVGIGLCMPDDGRDTVVSADESRAKLSLTERIVLARAEAKLKQGQLWPLVPRFAVFEAPSVLRQGEEHRPVRLRYAMLVDSDPPGALRTVLWAVDDEGSESGPVGADPRLLPDAPIVSSDLDARVSHTLSTTPVAWSFALNELPPGQPLPISPALRDLIARPRLDRPTLQALEPGLRSALRDLEAEAAR